MKVFTYLTYILACLLFLEACSPKKEGNILLKPGCQMLTYTIESKESGPDAYVRNETAVLDGETVKIGKVNTSIYKFDEQNRLIESSWATYNYGGNGGKTIYQYIPDSIRFISTHLGMAQQVHTFPLNKEGLSGGKNVKYDAEGFMIEKMDGGNTTKFTIENGNVVRKESRNTYPNAPVYVSLYEYDLTRPNLPNPYPFEGKISKNLLTKVTSSNGTYSGSYSYKYIFDETGNIIRRYQKLPNGNYLVDDYTVTCR